MQKRECEKCKNYVPYYIKKNLRYKKIFYGHCDISRKVCNVKTECKDFEEIDTIIKKEKELIGINNFLNRIAKDIETLKIFLTDTDTDTNETESNLTKTNSIY